MSEADDMTDLAGFGRCMTKKVGPAYKCPICGKRFGNRTLLKEHKNHDHRVTAEGGKDSKP